MYKLELKSSTSYNIFIKRGIKDELGSLIRSISTQNEEQDIVREGIDTGIEKKNIDKNYIKKTYPRKVMVVTDKNVGKLYLDSIKTSLKEECFEVFDSIIGVGEENKNIENLLKIYDSLVDNNFTRSDLILTLGGGVVGDIGGFAASTYLRGIDFVQVPTSLLAQVDSSVGGKTGIDLKQGKNLVGSFYQPSAVYIDPSFLSTLDFRRLKEGMAEVIKSAIISDEKFFERLENFSGYDELMKNIEEIIYTSCDIKRRFVEEDEFDKGRRMMLNFGHTLAHAIETGRSFDTTHGEAVSIGMCEISKILFKKGWMKEEEFFRIENILKKYYLPTNLEEGELEKIVPHIKNDKKNLGNDLYIVGIDRIGKAKIIKTYLDFFKDF